MSLLKKVTKKAYHKRRVQDIHNQYHDIKLLYSQAISSRTSKLDRQAVVDVDSLIIPGLELRLYDELFSIVSYKQPEYHNEELIRYVLDCIDTTHIVNISRTVLLKSEQGGLKSKEDMVIYDHVPVKIGLSSMYESKVIDVSIPKYTMLLSCRYELSIGDSITIADAKFDDAKVNSFVHITPGLCEVKFDMDPRWPL